MPVVAVEPALADGQRAEDGRLERRARSPEAVAAASDVVSVHVALTPETRGLIGAAFFDALRPGSYFINTSRAEVVDQAALARRGPRAGSASAGRVRRRARRRRGRLRRSDLSSCRACTAPTTSARPPTRPRRPSPPRPCGSSVLQGHRPGAERRQPGAEGRRRPTCWSSATATGRACSPHVFDGLKTRASTCRRPRTSSSRARSRRRADPRGPARRRPPSSTHIRRSNEDILDLRVVQSRVAPSAPFRTGLHGHDNVTGSSTSPPAPRYCP